MRRTVFMMATTILCATLAMAQNAPAAGAGQGGRRGPERVFQQLNLSADQQAQLQQLRQDQRTQMQALRNNTSLTPEQRKEQMKQLREANHQKVMALLTPDQQAQLQQLQQQRRGRMTAFNRGRGFQAMKSLNLTQQQQDQLKPIFESTRQQMQALRNDTSLTADQRRQKMQEIRQNQMAQMNAILTPEQQQQLQQMRQNWRGHRGPKAGPPQGF